MPIASLFNPLQVQGGPQNPMAQQLEGERLMRLAQAMEESPTPTGPNNWVAGLTAILKPVMAQRNAQKGQELLAQSILGQQTAAREQKMADLKMQQQMQQQGEIDARKARAAWADENGVQGPARDFLILNGKLPESYTKGAALKMQDGYTFNPQTGEATPIPGYAERQAQIAAASRAPRQPTEIEQLLSMSAEDRQRYIDLKQQMGGARSATPEQRETAKAEGQALTDAREKAAAARKTLENVARLEKMLAEGKSTGPIDQYIPGSDAQTFNAIAQDLNLSTLRQNFGGNPTEGERAANIETLPNLGRYETTNRELLAKIRQDAEQKLTEYETMRQGGGLLPMTGAAPGAPTQSAGAQAPAATNEPTAVNPQTGEKVVFRNGQWVKA